MMLHVFFCGIMPELNARPSAAVRRTTFYAAHERTLHCVESKLICGV